MDSPTDSPRNEDLAQQLLTEKEACAYLRVSKRNLYCWRMAGLIPYFKIGRAVRFRRADMDKALDLVPIAQGMVISPPLTKPFRA